jgi:S-adenosylhomocysteine hydrolase
MPAEELPERCVQFLAHDSFIIKRTKKGEVQEVDLRHQTISLTAEGRSMILVAKRGKPLEFARAISADDTLKGEDVRIEKLDVLFAP